MNFLKKLFKLKSPKSGIIFIVEDNPVYAKTLQSFLKTTYPDIKEIKIFPVGETCLLEINRNPDLIIVDHLLDTKYEDAGTGLEIIKEIRSQKPEMNILVLSAQKEVDVVLDSIKTYHCSYIKKDEKAFGRVEELINEI